MSEADSPVPAGEATDPAALQLTDVELAPGKRLGRYEILMPVAAGGTARVWAARTTGYRGSTTIVALKTILPHLAEDPEFERMFLDEARVAVGVHHPNVCEVYELGEEGKVLYLAMEWVHGDSLYNLLRDASGEPQVQLDARVAARVVADACAGLHAAHELTEDDGRPLGVVHRDVSPQNVFVTIDGHTKVADFGVAKALGQAHHATMAGQLRGKLAYMSPEQVGGAPVDRRSDVFSLGSLLYEVTTGIKAFDAEQEHLAMQAVRRGKYVRPSQLTPGYPAGLEAIVARALQRDPSARYATAEEMRSALEQWLARSGSRVVTQADVARVVRERVGPRVEAWKQRLRRASFEPATELARAGGPSRTPNMPRAWPSQGGVKAAAVAGAMGEGASSTKILAREVTRGLPTSGAPSGAPWVTPPPPAVAAARVGFDLMDPLIPSVPMPPRDMTALAEKVEAPGGGEARSRARVRLAMALVAGFAGAVMLGGVAVWLATRAKATAGVVRDTSAERPGGPISVRVTPPAADVLLGGEPVPLNGGGVRSLPRPAPGESVTAYVRAPGYEEQVVTLDAHSPATLHVTLVAEKSERRAPASPALPAAP